tara:strand:+ start:426 stop:551 length:126 start_codon:yes stop_codon:yes gene_type:complete
MHGTNDGAIERKEQGISKNQRFTEESTATLWPQLNDIMIIP